jgi:type II secretory pathway component PulJ
MRKLWNEKETDSQGTTLLEVVMTVTIFALLVMAFGGFLRSITVGGRNIPQGGSILTQQQVIDQVNILVVWLSRDVRSAALIEINPTGTELKILPSKKDWVYYKFQEENGTGAIVRSQGNSEKKLLQSVKKGSGNFFSPTGANNPDYVFVKLPVQYLSQTGRGKNDLEEREFSFIIVHRRVSD